MGAAAQKPASASYRRPRVWLAVSLQHAMGSFSSTLTAFDDLIARVPEQEHSHRLIASRTVTYSQAGDSGVVPCHDEFGVSDGIRVSGSRVTVLLPTAWSLCSSSSPSSPSASGPCCEMDTDVASTTANKSQ